MTVPIPSPIAFISYAHSTTAHRALVDDLVKTLRHEGLNVLVDSDVRTPQGPPEGWPKWMKRQMKLANWVLILFDEIYRRRFDGEEEPDKGLGATWEGAIITHQLYRNATNNTRFIPLLADHGDIALIPDELFGFNRYRIPSQSRELTARLLQATATDPGAPNMNPPTPNPVAQPLVTPTRLRHGADHLFGREKELAALDQAWDNPSTHVVTIVAWGGVGKTSLVVDWMARKANAGWPGVQRVFDWSFYSQGTREQGAASADAFIAKALEFFGDQAMANSPASPWDKGARLAQLVRERRTLLVLDGLEPLQYPPGPLTGHLKDPAVEALLKGLAQQNPGLCVVTTREHIADLLPFHDKTVCEIQLGSLNDENGARLLHRAGANRAGPASINEDDSELRAASQEVKGHALTLRILGTFLRKAHLGDIRKRDCVKFEQADAKVQGGHAFKVMAAYEDWFSQGGEDGARALAVLRLTGLFDRPADGGCVAALRRKPTIPGFTDAIVGLDDVDWNITLTSLADCGLISWDADQTSIDTHLLIREYFAQQLWEGNQEALRLAHRRLYEHLRDSTKDKPQPTLEDLQPLFHSVRHGCAAGMYEVSYQLYRERIQRNKEEYSTYVLAAYASNLAIMRGFFVEGTERSCGLSKAVESEVLRKSGSFLRAFGRLDEALERFRQALEVSVGLGWSNESARLSSKASGNISQTLCLQGRIREAVTQAFESLKFAERSEDVFERLSKRAFLADAGALAGNTDDAERMFTEAESMQRSHQPIHPRLYSLSGFAYCEFLLSRGRYIEAYRHSEETLRWVENLKQPVDVAMDRLVLGRSLLMQLKRHGGNMADVAFQHLTASVASLRNTGFPEYLATALEARADLYAFTGEPSNAYADLDEAWQIAERGPMRLHMADIHLYRARLFHKVTPYPWKSAKDDLAAARKLIQDCGYHRRDQELADAEHAILQPVIRNS